MAIKARESRIDVLQRTLDMLILQTLQWGPRHGLAITQTTRRKAEELLKVEAYSLSRSPPAGAAGMARSGMEDLSKRTACEVLPG